MSRTPLKVISNEEEKWIPPDYKDFDEAAEKIADRPLVFWGKKLTRDQRYKFQELGDVVYPEGYDPKDAASVAQIKVTGKGEAYKFIFDNCITKICNVMLQTDGEVEEIEELTGKDKQRYWNTSGDDISILGAISHFVDSSSLSESEAKN